MYLIIIQLKEISLYSIKDTIIVSHNRYEFLWFSFPPIVNCGVWTRPHIYTEIIVKSITTVRWRPDRSIKNVTFSWGPSPHNSNQGPSSDAVLSVPSLDRPSEPPEAIVWPHVAQESNFFIAGPWRTIVRAFKHIWTPNYGFQIKMLFHYSRK